MFLLYCKALGCTECNHRGNEIIMCFEVLKKRAISGDMVICDMSLVSQLNLTCQLLLKKE